MAIRWTEQKKRYRQYKARVEALPPDHRTAIEALERYLMFFGPGTTDTLMPMLEDLVDLFEQSVANGTSVRSIVGDDPVAFAEAFLRNYPTGQWIGKEQERLVAAIDSVTGSAT